LLDLGRHDHPKANSHRDLTHCRNLASDHFRLREFKELEGAAPENGSSSLTGLRCSGERRASFSLAKSGRACLASTCTVTAKLIPPRIDTLIVFAGPSPFVLPARHRATGEEDGDQVSSGYRIGRNGYWF